jgi:hypothetical protein
MTEAAAEMSAPTTEHGLPEGYRPTQTCLVW